MLHLRLLAAAGEVATLDAAAVLLGSPGGPCADAMPDVAGCVRLSGSKLWVLDHSSGVRHSVHDTCYNCRLLRRRQAFDMVAQYIGTLSSTPLLPTRSICYCQAHTKLLLALCKAKQLQRWLLCGMRSRLTAKACYHCRLALGHYVVQLAKGVVEALPGAFELPDAAADATEPQPPLPAVHAQAVSSARHIAQARCAAPRWLTLQNING